MEKKNILIAAVCLILGLAVGWLLWGGSVEKTGGIGTGTRLEDYLPGVLYNDGLYTEREIFTTSSTTIQSRLNVSATSSFTGVGIGTTTPSHDLSVNANNGTSTIYIGARSTGKGGCIQLTTTNGKTVRLYASTTPASTGVGSVSGIVVEEGVCE